MQNFQIKEKGTNNMGSMLRQYQMDMKLIWDNRINGKRGGVYKLEKMWMDNEITLYFSCTYMTALTELFTMNGMDKLKYELAQLV